MPIASLSSSLIDQLRHVSSGWVYLIVALLVFGEAAIFIGFILPGETAVIVAGVIASQGKINIVVLCVLVVVSAIAGDSVGYLVGQRYGERLLTWPLIRKRHVAIERALEGLRQRGPIYVFIGRFTAFLRAVMPGLAGMSKMHYRRFFVANAAGGLLWGVAYALLGYFAGGALSKIEHAASWAALALLVIVIVVVIVLHFRRKRKDALSDAQWVATHRESAEDVE